MVVLKQGYRDTNIIPDKYNTGCNENVTFTTINADGLSTSNFVFDTYGEGAVSFKFDNTINQSIPNNYIFENYDFTNVILNCLSTPDVVENKTIKFNNCKFNIIRNFDVDTNLKFEFNNCSIVSTAFNNVTFNNCKFGGGTTKDGINGFNNVTVNNCYIQDIWHENSNGAHADGFQTVGNTTYSNSINNFEFNNCRWEVPWFPVTDDGAGGGVNAAIFLQQTSGVTSMHDIYLNNCIINGGGYYSFAGGGTAEDGFDSDTVSIENPICGYAVRTSAYDSTNFNSILKNPRMQDALYVSSVYRDENDDVHLLVSNDTYVDRKLIVYTNNGSQSIDVPQCYNIAELWNNNDLTKTFSDFPFDVDVNIGQADYVVCYSDFVDENRQVRFVNYTNEDIVSPLQLFPCGAMQLLSRRTKLYTVGDYVSMGWISSDGVAYLDLGIQLTANHKVEIVFSDDGTSSYKTIYGARYSANMFTFGFKAALTPQHYFGSNTAETFSKISENTKYTYRWDNQIAYINDEVISDKSAETISYPAYNIFLLAENRASASANICTSGLKIYSCKIWDGDELILDLKPVKHQGKYKMRNLVENATQIYYENASTDGSFTCG